MNKEERVKKALKIALKNIQDNFKVAIRHSIIWNDADTTYRVVLIFDEIEEK